MKTVKNRTAVTLVIVGLGLFSANSGASALDQSGDSSANGNIVRRSRQADPLESFQFNQVETNDQDLEYEIIKVAGDTSEYYYSAHVTRLAGRAIDEYVDFLAVTPQIRAFPVESMPARSQLSAFDFLDKLFAGNVKINGGCIAGQRGCLSTTQLILSYETTIVLVEKPQLARAVDRKAFEQLNAAIRAGVDTSGCVISSDGSVTCPAGGGGLPTDPIGL